ILSYGFSKNNFNHKWKRALSRFKNKLYYANANIFQKRHEQFEQSDQGLNVHGQKQQQRASKIISFIWNNEETLCCELDARVEPILKKIKLNAHDKCSVPKFELMKGGGSLAEGYTTIQEDDDCSR
ncbi:hypothetical protein ACJX0J_034795, partial [Zea mays]